MSVIIEPFETSEPVPAVVGMATIGKHFKSSETFFPIISSTFLKLIPTAIAFEASIALPPPRPITKSTFFFFN